MLTRKTVLLAGIESPYGSPPILTGANAIQIANLDVNVDPTLLEREVYQDSISNFGIRVGKKIMTCSFDVELKGRGIAPTLASPIEFDPLLRACALIATDHITSGRVYNPTSDESRMDSVALKFNYAGQQYLMTGCYGNVSCNLVAGNFGILTFNFTGLYNKPSDVSQLQPVFINDTLPPIVESLGFKIDNYAGIAETLTFDLGNEISERPDLNSPEGLKGLRITNRNVTGSVDPEMVAISDKDFWDLFEKSTKIAIVATIGATVGNKFDLSEPEIQITNISPGDRNGLRIYNIDYTASGDDDEWSLRCY